MAGEVGVPRLDTHSQHKIRVYILDDHELIRRGLRDLMHGAGGIEVVGESGSAQDAADQIAVVRPDVALLDVHLPDGSGIEVCRQVRAQDDHIRVLMLTAYEDAATPLAAAMAGASGFLLKQVRGDELVAAVRTVAAGGSLLAGGSAEQLTRAVPDTEQDRRLASLTPQERRILDLIVDGMTNRQIGAQLGIRENTVKNYVTSVLVKLGFVRRTQAAVYGARIRRG